MCWQRYYTVYCSSSFYEDASRYSGTGPEHAESLWRARRKLWGSLVRGWTSKLTGMYFRIKTTRNTTTRHQCSEDHCMNSSSTRLHLTQAAVLGLSSHTKQMNCCWHAYLGRYGSPYCKRLHLGYAFHAPCSCWDWFISFYQAVSSFLAAKRGSPGLLSAGHVARHLAIHLRLCRHASCPVFKTSCYNGSSVVR